MTASLCPPSPSHRGHLQACRGGGCRLTHLVNKLFPGYAVGRGPDRALSDITVHSFVSRQAPCWRGEAVSASLESPGQVLALSQLPAAPELTTRAGGPALESCGWGWGYFFHLGWPGTLPWSPWVWPRASRGLLYVPGVPVPCLPLQVLRPCSSGVWSPWSSLASTGLRDPPRQVPRRSLGRGFKCSS